MLCLLRNDAISGQCDITPSCRREELQGALLWNILDAGYLFFGKGIAYCQPHDVSVHGVAIEPRQSCNLLHSLLRWDYLILTHYATMNLAMPDAACELLRIEPAGCRALKAHC